MKQKFRIDGICCGRCIPRLKKTLEAHAAIEKAEVFLNPIGITIITIKEALSVDELQKRLNTLEDYTITEIN